MALLLRGPVTRSLDSCLAGNSHFLVVTITKSFWCPSFTLDDVSAHRPSVSERPGLVDVDKTSNQALLSPMMANDQVLLGIVREVKHIFSLSEVRLSNS